MAEDVVFKEMKNSLKRVFTFYLKWIAAAVFVMLLVYYVSLGFFRVERHEIAIVQRFGQIVDGNVMPGLHYTMPPPFDVVNKVVVKGEKTLEIDNFAAEFKVDSKGDVFQSAVNLKPSCITGDNNIVTISIMIKYTIVNPINYLIKLKNPEQIMNSSAARATIHTLSKIGVGEILTHGKKKIESELKKSLQDELDIFESGIGVSFIEIREIKPPAKIQRFFDDVINAKVEKKKMINEADSYRNELVPKARSSADKMVQEARSYRNEKRFVAEGDSSRFLSRYMEYKKAKSVVRTKMYLEYINEMYPKLKEVRVVGGRGKKVTSWQFPFTK